MPEPFKIDISEEKIEDLRTRLRNTRWPDQIDPADWTAGTSLDFTHRLVDYWLDSYDWNKAQAKLNQLPQFIEDIDGMRVHFVHQRSSHEDALPLVMTHGWPGSFAEFVKIAPLLTEPKTGQAFHLICPSIPGYSFSCAPTEPGWGTARVASLQIELVRRLGYDYYGVQGGDWGSQVSRNMALQNPERIVGLHMNMIVALPPADMEDPMSVVTPQEAEGLQRLEHWRTDGGGYFQIQSTRPNTLGFGLTDSPVGLAAWMVEKYRAWTDCNGDLESVLNMDEVLTQVMLYWLTGSITSAARLYYEEARAERDNSNVQTATAAAIFPREIFCPPKAWAEKNYNLKRWTLMSQGGHFAALEQPQLLAQDIQEFFSDQLAARAIPKEP